MRPTTAEAIALFERLSDEGAKELVDYALKLVEKEDDEEWECIVERVTQSPKFAAYIAEVEREIREGRTEPIEVGWRRYRARERAERRKSASARE